MKKAFRNLVFTLLVPMVIGPMAQKAMAAPDTGPQARAAATEPDRLNDDTAALERADFAVAQLSAGKPMKKEDIQKAYDEGVEVFNKMKASGVLSEDQTQDMQDIFTTLEKYGAEKRDVAAVRPGFIVIKDGDKPEYSKVIVRIPGKAAPVTTLTP
jgi:hypothetical protein